MIRRMWNRTLIRLFHRTCSPVLCPEKQRLMLGLLDYDPAPQFTEFFEGIEIKTWGQ